MRKPSGQVWLPSLPSCSRAGSEVTEVAGQAAGWSLRRGVGLCAVRFLQRAVGAAV